MTKAQPKKKASNAKSNDSNVEIPQKQGLDTSNLPDDLKNQLDMIKEKITKFSDGITEKLKDYVTGIALIPPTSNKETAEILKDFDKTRINVIVLVDDRDSKKMSKQELKEKLQLIAEDVAKGVDPKILPRVEIYNDLFQSCYDGTYDLVKLIAISIPIYDSGILSALKISELHKVMLLKDFSKYIVVYGLGGSIVQGKMTPSSDIDTFVIIDDTDVKRMTRTELRDKLRAIVVSKGFEASNISGIQNKFQVQVWLLTDFWEGLKDSTPVYFTFLRDGLPLFDRGIFMPWKHLLQMGKIKPSPEAISMYMSSGEQMIKRVKAKMMEIGAEDLYWALQSPTQGAIMLYGLQPPTPKETADVVENIFLKKEKLVDKKFVSTFRDVYNLRKRIEHGDVKQVSGKEIDNLLTDCEDYLKRLDKLYDQINLLKQKESVLLLYENTVSLTRDAFKVIGFESISEAKILEMYKKELVDKGKILDKSYRLLKDIVDAKSLYDKNKLSKQDIEKLHKSSGELHRILIEFIQRTRFRELERAKVRFKHGEKIAEFIILGETGYIIPNIEERDVGVMKVIIVDSNEIKSIQPSSIDDYENAISDTKIPPKVFINEKIFEGLKKNFGNIEILINY